MAKTKFSIEGAFEQLEDIIEQLSSEEISLSDSMDLYKKGVKILDKCSQTLDKTQKEIIILQEGQNEACLLYTSCTFRNLSFSDRVSDNWIRGSFKICAEFTKRNTDK